MAIEPKSPRKRAVKKSKSKAGSENTDVSVVAPAPEAEAAPKTRKRAAAIPVPIFQAAESTDAPAKAPRRAKAKSGDEKVAAEDSTPASSAALVIAQSICSHDEVNTYTFARWQLPKTAFPEAAFKTPMGLDFPEKKRVGNKTEILPPT